MLRMSIWVHSYAVIHVWMTVNFRENRARLGLKDVAMKWLRLQPLFEYVSHIRIGCIQSVLAPWCVVAEHNMGSLTFYLDTPLQVGGGFWGFGGRPEPMWWCNVKLFRLQQASDLIPHPYWMYTKCFSTLICSVWAYGATLTVMRLCRSGVEFWGFGG